MKTLLIRFCLLLALVPAIHACSTESVSENDPAALYKDAEDEIKSDHYLIAIEKLRAIKNKFPYSSYAVQAQLRVADVYFMQESYPEAAGAYETFRDLHPKNEKVPYAMFRIAKSYYMDIPQPVARDMSPAQKALDAYAEFVRRFPQDPEVKEANADVAEIRSLLAQKELYIADFYYKRSFYDSARPRYQKILDIYPDTPPAAIAKEKLAKIDAMNLPKPKTGP